jgi:phage/conjugal plasmid C-4 type zinc finger TraR family protein
MSDVIDTTSEREQAITDAAIKNRQRFTGISAPVCGCGEPIPEARQRVLPGVTTCIDCAIFKGTKRCSTMR